mgnify:CR=1 FL=1
MKAYGVRRVSSLEYPDKADIKEFGMAPGKFGEKVKSVRKRAVRRYWKRVARGSAKEDLIRELKEV